MFIENLGQNFLVRDKNKIFPSPMGGHQVYYPARCPQKEKCRGDFGNLSALNHFKTPPFDTSGCDVEKLVDTTNLDLEG